jgi:hypothetical protein
MEVDSRRLIDRQDMEFSGMDLLVGSSFLDDDDQSSISSYSDDSSLDSMHGILSEIYDIDSIDRCIHPSLAGVRLLQRDENFDTVPSLETLDAIKVHLDRMLSGREGDNVPVNGDGDDDSLVLARRRKLSGSRRIVELSASFVDSATSMDLEFTTDVENYSIPLK